jgi:hypothetical protein
LKFNKAGLSDIFMPNYSRSTRLARLLIATESFKPVKITLADFLADFQGQKFSSIVKSPLWDFELILNFLSTPEAQRRMLDSIIHHERPPVAGIIKELERILNPIGLDPNLDQTRAKQAIGIAVKIVMEKLGYQLSKGKTTSLDTLTKWFARVPYYVPREERS